MAINQGLIAEFKMEAANTRKMLERVPADKFTWKPHDKSMELLRLAAHVARTPVWIGRALNATEFDFGNAAPPAPPITNVQELLAAFDATTAEAIKTLEGASDEVFMRPWTAKRGEKVFFTMPAIATVRSFGFSHFIHHRGQLSVYLRMLNVPVPGMYGPSADEAM